MEAKIAVDDLVAVETRLKQAGGQKKGEYSETDTFFDYENHQLKESDSALRLRNRENLQTHKSNFRLTFKGPRQPGPFKHRREIEFVVDPGENVRLLLECLGLKPFAVYTKKRNAWLLNNCAVEVDFIEGIGKFIEVEGPNEDSIRKSLAALNLADKPVIHESYLAMVLNKK